MARFVERQIDQMEKRFPGVVGFERRENKRSSPPEKQQKHCDPASERQRVCRRIRFDEPLFSKGHPARAVPLHVLPLQRSKRPILRKDDPALYALCRSVRLVSLTLGTRQGCGRGGLHSHMVGPSARSDKKISGLIQTTGWTLLVSRPKKRAYSVWLMADSMPVEQVQDCLCPCQRA